MGNTSDKPYILGITGTIGSGKSTVGRIISELSIPVIDTDHIVHNLLSTEISVISAIRDRFGNTVIKHNGDSQEVNREVLAGIIFDDSKAKKDLEAIVHPATILACRRMIQNHSSHPVVAVLVPLLFEAHLESEHDEIWTVYTEKEELKKRLSARDDLEAEEIEKRLQAQLPQEEKTKRAHHVIDNSSTKERTKEQILNLIDKIKSAKNFQLERSNDS